MFSTVPLSSAPGLDRPVLELMHADPIAVPAAMPLDRAVRLMTERHVHAVLVTDDNGVPLGWITARGMLHNYPRDWAGATAGDAITERVESVTPRSTARDALRAMLAVGGSHILVKSADGATVGVVSDYDLLTVMAHGAPGKA